MKPYFKPKLYLSARISTDAHANNNRIAGYLTNHFDVFKPHEHQADFVNHEMIGPEIYQLDLYAMMNSDLAVLAPPYGRDVAWEVGWYKGANKPVFVFAGEHIDWLRDLMLKGGVTAVFTHIPSVYERLRNDPVLHTKAFFLENPEQLGAQVLEFYDILMGGKILMGNP